MNLPRLEAGAIRRFLLDPWLWALVAITALGAFLRIYRLTEIPPGLTGDEAWTGINGRRIMTEGWIGAYVINGYGVPSGPLYWVAPFVGALGDTIFAVRLPMAILGTVTIPVAYLAFKEMAGKKAALIGAFLVAVSMWHIHLSRMAWPVISWPLLELATAGLLFWGFRTRRLLPFLLAGASMGIGVFTYNAYPVFLVALFAFLAWVIIRGEPPIPRRELLRNLALMSVVAIVFAYPMISDVLDSNSLIRNDGARNETLILNWPEWKEAGFSDRVELLGNRAWDYVKAMTWESRMDGADMLGITPILDRFTIVLGVGGLAYMAYKWRRSAHVMAWIMVLVLPASAVVTGDFGSFDGMYRRTFGLMPFITLAAAVPLALAWEHSSKVRPAARWALLGGVVVVLGLIAQVNIDRYFDRFANHPEAENTFANDITRASEYLADLPDKPYVYLYSVVYFYDYETQRYLAPNYPGENRDPERGGTYSLDADRSKDVVFLFLYPYFDLLPTVQAAYPGGQISEKKGSEGQWLYRAYYLPRDAQASALDLRPGRGQRYSLWPIQVGERR